MSKRYYVYIMASESGTLYIGVTNDIKIRVYQHKQQQVEGFTKKYSCHKLIYVEEYTNVYEALRREKQLKNWNRKKKEKLIQSENPSWKDLSTEF